MSRSSSSAASTSIFINHPQYIRDVLVTHQKNFTKSRVLERAKKLLGEGLLTSEGAAHLRQRRLAQPAFHRERIAGYAVGDGRPRRAHAREVARRRDVRRLEGDDAGHAVDRRQDAVRHRRRIEGG